MLSRQHEAMIRPNVETKCGGERYHVCPSQAILVCRAETPQVLSVNTTHFCIRLLASEQETVPIGSSPELDLACNRPRGPGEPALEERQQH